MASNAGVASADAPDVDDALSRLAVLQAKQDFMGRHIENVIEGDSRTLRSLSIFRGIAGAIMVACFGIAAALSAFDQRENADKLDRSIADAQDTVQDLKADLDNSLRQLTENRQPFSIAVESYNADGLSANTPIGPWSGGSGHGSTSP